MMNYPPPLPPGAAVALISPSSPAPAAAVTAGINFLRARGLQVKAGVSLRAHYAGFMAGTGYERAEEINNFFRDEEVKAIFCLRGGYSAARILPFLDYDLIKNNPKIFIGYSDVTALHLALNQKSNLITLHGPMVRQDMVNNFDTVTAAGLRQALAMPGEFYLTQPQPLEVLYPGSACGRLTGGNLTVIAAGIGTPFQIELAGKILFIEDVGEWVPRLDRIFTQLKYSGLLQGLKGLLVGDFKDCRNQYDAGYQVLDCIADCFRDSGIPVIYNLQAGHCSPNLTLPLGAYCQMNTADKTLRFFT